MSDMIEKVARAIYDSTWIWEGRSDGGSGWDGIGPTLTGDRYRQFARAAIEALREPSDAMREAARNGLTDTEDWAGDLWRAMIDAAASLEAAA